MRDRDTGRSRGFGFVTFSSGSEGQSAIDGMNDQDLDGRRIKVNLANARPGGGGGGGGQGGMYLYRRSLFTAQSYCFQDTAAEAEATVAEATVVEAEVSFRTCRLTRQRANLH